MKFTVFGSAGFIGSHVVQRARQLGHEVVCPGRDESVAGQHLGHAIYCIGLTSDFRQRPHDTVTAHVTKLQQVLQTAEFESLVYLSSTRVYSRCPVVFDSMGQIQSVHEDTAIPVLSTDFSDLYNLSKLMGESIALTHGPRVKVARLSNVVGPDWNSDNFLISVVRDCLDRGRVEMRTSAESSKDYIAVTEVADILLHIAQSGRHPIYNVASGVNCSNGEIAERLAALTGAHISIAPNSPTWIFPPIETSRLRNDLGYTACSTDALLVALVNEFRTHRMAQRPKDAA